MLEVIDKGACSKAHPTPLLFVHGAWHAAWCWDEHFLDFFAERGYRAVALSLRGHGGSSAPKVLRGCSIADYVADVRSVVDTLPRPPVVIGHSMGGYVVQRYLESHPAPAGVLLASIPPRGTLAFTARFFRRHPWRTMKGLLTGDTTGPVSTAAMAREHLFSADTPESVVTRCVAMMQQESKRVVYVDALFLHPRPRRVVTPVFVLGAQFDGCFSVAEVRATATAYRTTAEIFPEMGHDMMIEPGWSEVADRIDRWLSALTATRQ